MMKNSLAFRCLIILICALACNLYASDLKGIRFSHLGLEDGLSHSTIFSINQDKNGYMWFATPDGLNRFNGYDFTVYRHQYGDSTSIACKMQRVA